MNDRDKTYASKRDSFPAVTAAYAARITAEYTPIVNEFWNAYFPDSKAAMHGTVRAFVALHHVSTYRNAAWVKSYAEWMESVLAPMVAEIDAQLADAQLASVVPA